MSISDATEQELVAFMDRSEPALLRRAFAHLAGRLAELEGVANAEASARRVADALSRMPRRLDA